MQLSETPQNWQKSSLSVIKHMYNPANYGDIAIRGFPSEKCVSLSGEIAKQVNQDPGKYIKE
jgi:hypothetical protein